MRLWDRRVKCGRIKSLRTSIDMTDNEDLIEDQMKNIIVLTQKDCYHGKIESFCKYNLCLLFQSLPAIEQTLTPSLSILDAKNVKNVTVTVIAIFLVLLSNLRR